MNSRFALQIVAVALLLSAVSLSAAPLSEKYEQWREGPAQWIMTSEEQKAWKAVKTDEEANRFIDLFWARRDPSPNTPANEYRAAFLERVRNSDEQFAEPRRKGSMTDRGRAYIVLGAPTTGGMTLKGNTMHTLGASPSGMRGSGNRQTGSKDTWSWDHDAASKWGMPQVNVVFIEDPVTGKVQRDPGRSDFPKAAEAAIKASIANPDLTEVPAWAEKNVIDTAVVPMPAADTAAPSGEQHASKLTLLTDVYSIVNNSKADPFTKMTPISTFAAPGAMGWAAQ
ncbi:MAG: GWxTD domain-containing protein, partial [Thermoanaerobaculia bacterium]